MTQSVGGNPIGRTSARAPKPYDQAYVLQREFDELHPESVKKSDKPHHESINKKEQTPLADPSLKPDGQGHEQRPTQHKIDKAPSQQSDKDRQAEMLRSVWQKVH